MPTLSVTRSDRQRILPRDGTRKTTKRDEEDRSDGERDREMEARAERGDQRASEAMMSDIVIAGRPLAVYWSRLSKL